MGKFPSLETSDVLKANTPDLHIPEYTVKMIHFILAEFRAKKIFKTT